MAILDRIAALEPGGLYLDAPPETTRWRPHLGAVLYTDCWITWHSFLGAHPLASAT
jgi:hypothetical protein